MITAALGCGMLSLSFVCALSGWVIGFILIIIGCIAGIWSSLLIAKLTVKYRIKNYDEIAFVAGGKCLCKFTQIMMLLYVFGVCIAY